jgi:hypothetical protein
MCSLRHSQSCRAECTRPEVKGYDARDRSSIASRNVGELGHFLWGTAFAAVVGLAAGVGLLLFLTGRGSSAGVLPSPVRESHQGTPPSSVSRCTPPTFLRNNGTCGPLDIPRESAEDPPAQVIGELSSIYGKAFGSADPATAYAYLQHFYLYYGPGGGYSFDADQVSRGVRSASMIVTLKSPPLAINASSFSASVQVQPAETSPWITWITVEWTGTDWRVICYSQVCRSA